MLTLWYLPTRTHANHTHTHTLPPSLALSLPLARARSLSHTHKPGMPRRPAIRKVRYYTLHPTPYTLHPTPYSLYPTHPAPCTLHPAPYALHPTPYTLHHKQEHKRSDAKNPLMVVSGIILFSFTYEALVRVFGYQW